MTAVPASSAQDNLGPQDFVLVSCRSVHGAGKHGLQMARRPAWKTWGLRIPFPTHAICRNGDARNSSSMGGSDLDALPGSCGARSRGAIPAVEFFSGARNLNPPPCNCES